MSMTIPIKLHNAGDMTLHLKDVKVSCGCVSPKHYIKEIAPGADSVLEVIYSAHSRSQFYEQSVVILSDDPEVPAKQIRLAGAIKGDDGFQISATGVRLSRIINSSQSPSQEIILSDSKGPIGITSTNCVSPNVRMKIKQISAAESHLTVEVSRAAESFTSTIVLLTKVNGKDERMEIPISYEVRPKYETYPDVVPLPPAESQASFARIIVKSNAADIPDIERITPIGLPPLTTEIKRLDSRDLSVIVHFNTPIGSATEKQRGITIYFEGESDRLFVPAK
jgi:hypothetical protein